MTLGRGTVLLPERGLSPLGCGVAGCWGEVLNEQDAVELVELQVLFCGVGGLRNGSLREGGGRRPSVAGTIGHEPAGSHRRRLSLPPARAWSPSWRWRPAAWRYLPKL